MITLPAWLFFAALLLALVSAPSLVLAGAWIAYRLLKGKSPLPSFTRGTVKVLTPDDQQSKTKPQRIPLRA